MVKGEKNIRHFALLGRKATMMVNLTNFSTNQTTTGVRPNVVSRNQITRTIVDTSVNMGMITYHPSNAGLLGNVP